MIKFSSTTAKILIGTATVLAAMAPIASQADDAILVHRTVSTAGLDLNTTEGVSTLYGRLKSAARSLCSPVAPRYPTPSWAYRTCEEDALAKVVRSQNRTLLTQKFIGDFGAEASARHGIEDTTQLAKQ